MNKMKHILIIKPSALGDVIQAISMLPVIKQYNPAIKISWLVFEHNQDIVINHPLIDEVFVLRRHGNSLRHLWRLIKKLRSRKFDAVIDVQCLLRSAVIAWLTGCKRRIGFANGREMSTLFYTEKYNIPTRSMHAVDGYLKLCEALGMSRSDEIVFPLPVSEEQGKKKSAPQIVKPLITICPTARWKTKCWPKVFFAELADILKAKYQGTIIFVGAANEHKEVESITHLMQQESVNLAGKISLMEVAALLRQTNLYVGNDSGLMHMAAATKTPTVAIFGPTDPHKTGPYSSNAKVVTASFECMPCFSRNCKHDMRCMRQLPAEQVAQACYEVLQKNDIIPVRGD